MRKISTDKAPAAIGPYSQAVLAGDFLYASGQIPINPATGNVEAEGITAQAEIIARQNALCDGDAVALLHLSGTLHFEIHLAHISHFLI